MLRALCAVAAVALLACRDASRELPPPQIRPLATLDDAHAAAFRQAFDAAADRPRYIVAVSPT